MTFAWDELEPHIARQGMQIQLQATNLEPSEMIGRTIVFHWEDLGWSIGTIVRSTTKSEQRKSGCNFLVRHTGEDLDRFHLLLFNEKCAAGGMAPAGSWCFLM